MTKVQSQPMTIVLLAIARRRGREHATIMRAIAAAHKAKRRGKK